MSGPVLPSSTVFPRADLMGYLRGHTGRFNGLVGASILPPVVVGSDEGSFLKVPAAASLTRYKTQRGADGGYQRRSWTGSTGTFQTQERGLETPISDRKRRKYRNQIDLERFEAIENTRGVLREYEADVIATVVNETNFPASGTTGASLSTAWDNASATPAADVDTGATAIFQKTGVMKSELTLCISYYTFNKLTFVTDVYTRLKIDSAAFGTALTAEQLATYFGVKKVLVSATSYNSADAGQTAVMAAMWNEDYAFLFVGPPDEGTEAPQLGRTAVWIDDLDAETADAMDAAVKADIAAGGNPVIPMIVEMYREDARRQDVLRTRGETDEVIFNLDCGYLIKNTKT